ncbi:MAG: hypothetical protein IPJ84_08265 [Bdellovibrionales bacterium]|nr:hypothetical protein [Bdellovibrionales bacterium]
MLRILSALILSSILVRPAAASNHCQFEKIELTATGTSSRYPVGKRTLLLDEANNDHTTHEGPLKITQDGKTLCTFSGGNYSAIYVNSDQSLLMTEEFSGSCGGNRVIDIKNCKVVGMKARYCGNAKIAGLQLVNEPPCESLDNENKVASCSTAHVYDLKGRSCKPVLNKAASARLTKEKLGVELPFEKAHRVEHPRTPQAKIQPEK